MESIKNITPYTDINDILVLLLENLQEIYRDQLVGLYLMGSLAYGDFHTNSSDIDFLVILGYPSSKEQLSQVKYMHNWIGEKYPTWAKRLEGSYITQDMLSSIKPPRTPRPYINEGSFLTSGAHYGNEWLLNLQVLYECGVALIGPRPKELMSPIDMKQVRAASRKDLYEEWAPKLENFAALEDSHLQAYSVLTLCRILYRAQNDEVVSKRVASAWVKETYGNPWIGLIEQAENWHYGQEMNRLAETLNFLRFTLEKVG
jgi:hypothetical protein